MFTQNEEARIQALVGGYKNLTLEESYNIIARILTSAPMNGEAELKTFQKGDKVVYAILSQPFSDKALLLLHEEIRPLIDEYSKNSLFLSKKSAIGPEVIYGLVMAERYGIPTEYPIITMYDKDTINKAINKGMDSNYIYLSLYFLMLKTTNEAEKTLWALSEYWDMDGGYLKSLVTTYGEMVFQQAEEIIKKEVIDTSKIQNELVSIAIELSGKRLEQIMAKWPNKTKIFANIDRHYKDILERI